MRNILLLIALLTFLNCCKKGKVEDEYAPETLIKNCGKIVRFWSEFTSFEQGNPCGSGTDLPGNGSYTIQVKNNISGNIKNYCVNSYERSRYDFNDTYCDDDDPFGW